VSPFVGRLDDVGENGMALVGDIVSCFDHYKFGTQVIAPASDTRCIVLLLRRRVHISPRCRTEY